MILNMLKNHSKLVAILPTKTVTRISFKKSKQMDKQIDKTDTEAERRRTWSMHNGLDRQTTEKVGESFVKIQTYRCQNKSTRKGSYLCHSP